MSDVANYVVFAEYDDPAMLTRAELLFGGIEFAEGSPAAIRMQKPPDRFWVADGSNPSKRLEHSFPGTLSGWDEAIKTARATWVAE